MADSCIVIVLFPLCLGVSPRDPRGLTWGFFFFTGGKGGPVSVLGTVWWSLCVNGTVRLPE